MDEEIRKLVNKKYSPRASSVTPVPDDDTLRKILKRVDDSETVGLSWNSRADPRFTKRLKKLGCKLHEGNECWQWGGSKARNGVRPQFKGKSAYLATVAAWQNAPYRTYPDLDVDHRCGNTLCVRPGLGHAQPNFRSFHAEAGKPGGVRPKKVTAKKIPANKKSARPRAKP